MWMRFPTNVLDSFIASLSKEFLQFFPFHSLDIEFFKIQTEKKSKDSIKSKQLLESVFRALSQLQTSSGEFDKLHIPSHLPYVLLACVWYIALIIVVFILFYFRSLKYLL